jgi:hypothetical protein
MRRLERALARAEAASDRVAVLASATASSLPQRHQRLREKTQEAIAAIDRLTGTA